MTRELHSTSKRILAFIVRYKRQNDGNSPSYREIIEGTDVGSTSIVHYHLGILEERGIICRGDRSVAGTDWHRTRGIQITGGEWIPPSDLIVMICPLV